MTIEFVLRLDKKRAEHLGKEARRRRKSRAAVVEQALDNFIGEPPSKRNGKTTKPKSKGAGWPARLRELRRLSREAGHKPLNRDIVAEFRAIDLDGCWPL